MISRRSVDTLRKVLMSWRTSLKMSLMQLMTLLRPQENAEIENGRRKSEKGSTKNGDIGKIRLKWATLTTTLPVTHMSTKMNQNGSGEVPGKGLIKIPPTQEYPESQKSQKRAKMQLQLPRPLPIQLRSTS